jgi:predicted aminopeptidase
MSDEMSDEGRAGRILDSGFWILSSSLLLSLLLLSGCAPAYVLRLAYEEARILWRREPIAELLRRDLDARTREKLEIALAVREFARAELGLSVDGSYSSVARVDDDQIVHVVTAAPRDRLEAYTWWFPIAGRVPYRGYFDVEKAQALAQQLEGEGYDTYVRPSIAFSTLGWFDDPLLSNLLRHDSLRLAEVILHELLHNTTYVGGHASFNESFATFVGWRGTVAFFTARGDLERARRAEAAWQDAITFSRTLANVIAQLERAYADGAGRGDRTALFESARAEFRAADWQTDEYEDVAERPLNNAVLVHQRLYADRLELFERYGSAAGADLATTIRRIGERARSAEDPFAALSEAVVQGSVASSRLRPERTEPPSTAATSVTTAANEAITVARVIGSSPVPASRLRKTTYTGQASRTTTAPTKDMQRIM